MAHPESAGIIEQGRAGVSFSVASRMNCKRTGS